MFICLYFLIKYFQKRKKKVSQYCLKAYGELPYVEILILLILKLKFYAQSRYRPNIGNFKNQMWPYVAYLVLSDGIFEIVRWIFIEIFRYQQTPFSL